MSEYQRTMIIEAELDKVFDFVSEVSNVPKYLPSVKSADRQLGDRIRVQGRVGGRDYDSDGYFRVDKATHRLEWGSDGEDNYHGWLQVEPGVEEGFTSRVTVHLFFTPDLELARKFEKQGGDRDAVINEGIDEALRSIKNLCEGTGDKVESQTAM